MHLRVISKCVSNGLIKISYGINYLIYRTIALCYHIYIIIAHAHRDVYIYYWRKWKVIWARSHVFDPSLIFYRTEYNITIFKNVFANIPTFRLTVPCALSTRKTSIRVFSRERSCVTSHIHASVWISPLVPLKSFQMLCFQFFVNHFSFLTNRYECKVFR